MPLLFTEVVMFTLFQVYRVHTVDISDQILKLITVTVTNELVTKYLKEA